MIARTLAVLALLASTNAYSTGSPSRRDVMKKIASGTLFGITGAALPTPRAEALELCNPKANNCVRKTWTPPAGTSKEDAISALRDAINAYPQEGQAGVDGGGWVIAEDDLSGSGLARVEYKSSGKGNFAKFFNGGKPFVDDLKLEVEGSGVVQVKSQSRVGDSDFGVNGKRVDYLEAELLKRLWTI